MQQKTSGYDGCLVILIILLLSGCWAFGQPPVITGTASWAWPAPRDTIRIHDTISIPVPLYQALDTAAYVYLTRSNRPVLRPCFVVRQGFQQDTPKGRMWVQEPALKAIYNKRWKLIDRKKIQKLL